MGFMAQMSDIVNENFDNLGGVVACPELSADGICLNTAVSEFEKNLIYQSLERTDWVSGIVRDVELPLPTGGLSGDDEKDD